MNKNIIYFNKSRLNAFVIATLTVLFTGCSGGNIEELNRLNELETKLVENQENLNIDIEPFKLRLKEMEKDLSYYKTEAGDTISLEFSQQLSKFDVIRKIYTKNITSFTHSTKEQNELEEQIKNLRLDLEEGNISKEEFKEYFKKEEMDIEALLLESKEIKKALYQVEPDYRRIAKIIEKRMEIVDPTLRP
ncbi:MAG: hypothetical protein KJP21_01860 [Bacteroidia bacterium]|nr:hypothetical protein [Bacteroidia bacterium]NNJ56635.1 hypothetical protein [Bacteroidia bacterium]